MYSGAPSEAQIQAFMGIPIEVSFMEMADNLLEVELQRLIVEFRRLYAVHSQLIRPFDLIPELLKELKSKGLMVGIATSKKRAVAKLNCQAAGIDGLIDSLVGSDDVSAYKPHPESVSVAMKQMKTKFDKVIVIGDSIHDVRMGQAAGVD